MPLKTDERRHLVAALLTVNGYPVERAAVLMPAFEEAGLLDLRRTAELDGGALSATMDTAGYAAERRDELAAEFGVSDDLGQLSEKGIRAKITRALNQRVPVATLPRPDRWRAR